MIEQLAAFELLFLVPAHRQQAFLYHLPPPLMLPTRLMAALSQHCHNQLLTNWNRAARIL
jgi:hypothetical protein